MGRTAKIAGAVIVMLTLCACVAGSADAGHAASGTLFSQFLLGVWHGLIAPVTLLVEVINVLAPHVLPWQARLYETRTTGIVYDVGFYIGLASSPVMIGGRFKRRRRSRNPAD
jgi:hypothetical protein